MLMGAGYRGTDPEMQAAHDRALCEMLYEAPEQARELVDILYRRLRPELLTLEARGQSDATEAGARMREFLHYVRFCILSWIVSTVARPRDRLGFIDAQRPAKRFLVAAVFTEHLKPLLATSEFSALDALVRRHEEHELSLGALAQRGAQEQRLSLQMGSLPDQLAARISDPQTGVAQAAVGRVDSIMTQRAIVDQARKTAEAKIATYKRLRDIFGPICASASFRISVIAKLPAHNDERLTMCICLCAQTTCLKADNLPERTFSVVRSLPRIPTRSCRTSGGRRQKMMICTSAAPRVFSATVH